MTQTVDILIVGAGFSGLIMAMEARKRGFTDIAIIEKADDVGGTWRENTYPGVACDVPSHLYCFATHLNPDWSTAYAGGGEIQRYVQKVARDEGLYELCHFRQTFETAHWSDGAWHVKTQEGAEWQSRVLVSGMGALHVPAIPEIEGAESFPGPAFHSAHWDHATDLKGKRVAVVGTGASAVQFVPEIAKEAADVSIFQRTAPYVLPRPDGPISPFVRGLYRRMPILPRIRRAIIFRLFEMRHATFLRKDRAVNFAMKLWRKALEGAIPDPEERKKLTPPYQIGCKRILSSNDWYPALARPNVHVIPDGVARIEGNTLVAQNGQRADADVLVWGTGFHVTDALNRLDITGKNGLALSEAWKDGMQAHLGTGIAGFPNFFILLGPHTGLGHNSVVLMIEAQVEHLGRVLSEMAETGVSSVMPKKAKQAAFETEIQDGLADTVWQTGGCLSWYLDENGRNTTLWPGTVRAFQNRMTAAGLEEYEPVGSQHGRSVNT